MTNSFLIFFLKKKIVFFICIFFTFLFASSVETKDNSNSKITLPFDSEWATKHYKKKEKGEISRLLVIINHFGIHEERSKKILNIIPDSFGLALSPYQFPSKKIMKIIEKQNHNIFFIQPVTPYRDTFSYQDPYRLNADYDEKTNEDILLKTMGLIPENAKGVMLDEASSFTKDCKSLSQLLNHLKKKKLPLISPELPFDNECRKNCELFSIPLFEADYFISKNMNREDVNKLLSKLQDLLSKTNYALLVVEEDVKNVSLVVDWIQSFMTDQPLKLISFEELLNDKNLS